MRAFFIATFVLIPLGSYAGDLSDLPRDEGAFKEKIAAFIKPGDGFSAAVRFLGDGGFLCIYQSDGEGVWCDRRVSEALTQRRYQVILRKSGEQVSTINATFGRIGP